MPPRITPHSFRHTFTFLLFAIGEDPVSVMGQLGHTDPAFTLRAYAHAMGGDAGERERLRALTADDHGEGTIRSEENRLDAARSAEFVVAIRTADLLGDVKALVWAGSEKSCK